MTNLDRCFNIFDLREAAQRRLPRGIFEYVDKGTEDGISLEENRAAFQRIKLRTCFLNDWSKRDLGTEIFGQRINLPFGIAPTGSAGLMWYRGEVELARAAAAAGIPFTLAMGALTSLEDITRAVPDSRKWFQLYPWEDEAGNYEMVARARDLGWEALVVTIDHAPGRGREHNERNGFSFPFTPNMTAAVDMAMHPGWMWRVMRKYLVNEGMPTNANFPERYRHSVIDGKKRVRPKRFTAMTWEHIRKFRDFWPRKLIVKSILSGDQARAAVDAGADAIVVSNHGGRAFDSAIATIDILPEVVEAVGDRCTVILDSGIRRGSDILKALALGAKMVLVGRATLYGTACGGQAGAARAIQILAGEMERSFGYVGVRSVAEIGPQIFAHRDTVAPSSRTAERQPRQAPLSFPPDPRVSRSPETI
jgi:isopentenyl diphosphate isomerase/L-lactate dehydrogenase-like FMN-dependent dehydrogenase